LHSKAFTGAVVKPVHRPVQFRLSDRGENAVLREVLANQAIGVLISAAFPGRIWMGEIELSLQRPRDILVIAELPAVVGGDGPHAPQPGRQQPDRGISCLVRAAGRQLGE